MKFSKDVVKALLCDEKTKRFILDNKLYKLDNSKYKIVSDNTYYEMLFNNLVGVTKDGDGRITELHFSGDGMAVLNLIEYDVEGRIKKTKVTVDNESTVKEMEYDNKDRIIQLIEYQEMVNEITLDDMKYITTYEYDGDIKIEHRGDITVSTDEKLGEILTITSGDDVTNYIVTPKEFGYEYGVRKMMAIPNQDQDGEVFSDPNSEVPGTEDVQKELRYMKLKDVYIRDGVREVTTYNDDGEVSSVILYVNGVAHSNRVGCYDITYEFDQNNNVVLAWKCPLELVGEEEILKKDGAVFYKKGDQLTDISLMKMTTEIDNHGILRRISGGNNFQVIKKR